MFRRLSLWTTKFVLNEMYDSKVPAIYERPFSFKNKCCQETKAMIGAMTLLTPQQKQLQGYDDYLIRGRAWLVKSMAEKDAQTAVDLGTEGGNGDNSADSDDGEYSEGEGAEPAQRRKMTPSEQLIYFLTHLDELLAAHGFHMD
jgi:hypothetical protein